MSRSRIILLAIPHYVYISDLLRTKYIEYLASKYRVIILTPFIDEEVAKGREYFQFPNVIYIKYPMENPRFWSLLKLLRISLVNEFDYLFSIKHFYKRPVYKNSWKRRILRFFGKPFYKILTADFFSKLESLLLLKSEKLRALFDHYRPCLVVTATPGFDAWEAPIILNARKSGIPTVAINFTWDNLTMNAKHIRKTDYLIAWNSIMKKEAMNIHHYSAEKVFVSGTPRFDPYFEYPNSAPSSKGFGNPKTPILIKEPAREEFLKSKGLNPKYKTIFHTTVTKAYPFQKKYIRDLIRLRKERQIPYVNLFIRIHPLDIYENYSEFFDVPDLRVEKAGREVEGGRGEKKVEMSHQDLLNLKYSLKFTDLNINYASTISIEACIFDKPIINIGYLERFALAYEFNHYRPIYESGAIRLAKTDEDLPKLINMYLKNPALDSESRRRIVEQYVGFTDGLSYKRSVDYLSEILWPKY